MQRVIVDTGPIIAVTVQREEFHEWAAARFHSFRDPLLTCESVLTEASFLLKRRTGSSDVLLDLVERGVIVVDFDLASEIAPVRKLMQKYADVPMSLADACLVRMTELHPDAVVFTIDGDFKRYRRERRRKIPLIIPENR